MNLSKKAYLTILLGISLIPLTTAVDAASPSGDSTDRIQAFGEAGKFKMLYDGRQRPQTVLLKGRLYIVFNADAKPSRSEKGSAYPMLITYNPRSRSFSEPTRLGKSSTDHHHSPIIWADEEDYLHVILGCHNSPGKHLVSENPVQSGASDIAWRTMPQIATMLSYPTVYRIHGNKELIYYRTAGHTSSWTYQISEDNGKTWNPRKTDVTDMDSEGRLDWSSYQTKLPSKDGRFLHVVYTDYDDNKNSPDPQRFFNPRYKALASNEWKYNLSYVKIDLQTGVVRNSDGKELKTPIDIDYSKEYCEIWNTEWRGAGVPPVMSLDEEGEPTFLHVLSEDSLKSHRYYYVRKENGKWLQTPICHSNHQWNSCYLSHDKKGGIHAYVVVGDGYLEGGYMDRHGGGSIEEWISNDKGKTWNKHRDVTPDPEQYAGWRFNNIQPVVRPDGTLVDGMLLFYGWKDKTLPEAQGFLLHE